MSTEILPEGTVVRVTERAVSGDENIDDQAATPGREYAVFDYVASEHGDNDDPNGKPYYLLDSTGSFGGSHWTYPELVEVVRTVEQQRSRKPPTIEELRAFVSSALHHDDQHFSVDSTDWSGEGSHVCAEGTTPDGLRVSFRVRIDQIEVEDS